MPRLPSLLLLSAALWVLPTTPPVSPDGPAPEERTSSQLLALHRYWGQSRAMHEAEAGAGPRSAARAADLDQDQVAILEDRGDLVMRRNPFDLDGVAVRLTPNAAGGYDPARLMAAVEPPGPALGLGDNQARAVDLPWPFFFFGRRYDRVFVQSDGSLAFGAPETGPGAPGLARFLSGPARIAGLFTSLGAAHGGVISARTAADRAVFVWSAVPGAGQVNRNTFQVTLLPSGQVELAYAEVQTREATVGLTPGAGGGLTAADFSAAQPSGSSGPLVERFSETEKVDLVSVVRRFLESHPDQYDQLVIYTTRPLNPLGGSLAFEIGVKNEIRGVGLEIMDDTAQWGSAGRLESIVFMDAVDPYQEVDGFEILGQEVGHRWLSRLRFRAPSGQTSGVLLGRGAVHWSFFLDSDASVMEGNEIEDLGGGRFRTVDITRRYSALDQYAMGLRGAAEVPPFFYVEAADDFRPNRAYKASSAPEVGVSFTGLRREVRMEDVLAAMGPRLPEASRSPHLLRQAYLLVADAQGPATDVRRRAVARIREHFEGFYSEATGGRGSADTTLF